MRSKPADPLSRKRCTRACDTCKRRKERCDGAQPCGRCIERGVNNSCCFDLEHGRQQRQHGPAATHLRRSHRSSRDSTSPVSATPSSGTPWMQPSSPATIDQSRLILDRKGRVMFIGDSASPSFLQAIRRLLRDCQGPSAFVDDPLRPRLVEASPEGGPKWLDVVSEQLLPTLSVEKARHFAQLYYLATSGVLDLFDKDVILEQLPLGVSKTVISLPLAKPLVYLIMAIGAQAAVEDTIADDFFSYGRHLTARYLMEDSSIMTVQAYLLIVMFLLAACRRNAAFMHLGFAVRSAYALGLHLESVSSSFSEEEFKVRERLWRAVRSLDLFTSASLGRPPATAETRDTHTKFSYSASLELYSIFEIIMSEVYGKRKVTTTLLNDIGLRQRQWAACFTGGLAADSVEQGTRLSEMAVPNIGLIHVKQTYYWTIMLLTRPFLMERVTAHAQRVVANPRGRPQACTFMETSRTLVHACVDSAIRSIALLEHLIDSRDIPKRLPFVIASTVHSALVLGLAYFGDLYQIFPLQKHLQLACRLLRRFPSDAIASRNASIIQYLQDACQAYFEKRHTTSMDLEGQAIYDLFGQIHESPLISSDAVGDNIGNNVAGLPSEGSPSVPRPSASVAVGIRTNTLDTDDSEYSHLTAKDSTEHSITCAEDHTAGFGFSSAAGIGDIHFSFEGTPHTLWLHSESEMANLFAPMDAMNPDEFTIAD